MKKKLLIAISIFASALPAFSQSPCTTTNATGCSCEQPGITNCDLLPDINVGKPPLQATGNYGVIEYSQSGNGSNNAKLRLSVSTPNIGRGPLEVRTTNTYVCGTDTFIGTAPSICPDGISYPKQLIKQRIYHKNGNTMTYYDRPAGTMTYHPAHGHMHVDDWGVYTLRTATVNPNPLTWPIVATGAKLAFCLMDYGSCSYYNGHCKDSAGNTLINSSFPNFGLGGGNYNCSPVVQGISSGYTDIYYQYLDGMWINLPPGLCNGSYHIVVQLDPYNYFLESNENNNVIAVPYTLTKQTSLPTITGGANATICSGNSATITVGGASSYSWLPATGLNSTTGNSVIASPTSNTVYTVTGTAGSGCTKTKAITVTVNAKPTLTLTGNNNICTGQSTLKQVSGASSYSWAPATGLSNTAGTSVTASPSTTTTYTVTGTGGNGCTATTTFTINVTPYPSVSVSGNSTICSGNSSVLTASGANNYAWVPSTGLNATTGSTVTASPASTTTYTVTGTTNGCSSTSTKTVNVNQSPAVTATPGLIICSGQQGSLQASGAASYTWLPSSGLNATTGSQVNASPATSTSYTVTGTAVNGCTATALSAVTVNQTPVVTVSGSPSICPGESVLLEASGADEYTWLPVSGLDTIAGPEVTATPVTTTTYAVTGTTEGCSAAQSITVTVNAIPVPVITGLDTAYFDNSPDVTLTGIPAGGTFSGPGITGNIFSPAAAGIGGPYVITYNYTDNNGCEGITSLPVEILQHVVFCGIPTQTDASDISPFQATIHWDPTVTANKYKIRYRKVGGVTYKWKTVTIPNSTSSVISNLLPNTTYECWVRCYCMQPTGLSNKIIFTTGGYPYSCLDPFGLQAINVTSTTATVIWDPSISGDSVQVRFTKAAGTPAYKYRKSNVNTSFINISNLAPSTTYNWSVRVYCNGAAKPYSATGTFTTLGPRVSSSGEADDTRLAAYPNPARDHVSVIFSSESDGKGRIKIIDLTGRLVFSKEVPVKAGENLQEINLEGYSRGAYMLSFESQGSVSHIKLHVK